MGTGGIQMRTDLSAGTTISQVIGLVIAMMAFLIGLSFLLSFPVMLLWNGCLVPAVAGVSEIGWLQAWGLSILLGMLFKSNSTQQSK